MFWKRTGDETFVQNGVKYIISNAANQDTYACRGLIYEIWQQLAPDRLEELNFDNYLQWRKELVTKLKDWEKKYHKHAKTINPEMALIHKQCMQPLSNLMESNWNLYNFKELQKKKKEELPEFRYTALEEKYIEHFTKICDILSTYGTLEDYYDIRQMLTVLKTPNWETIEPLRFYLQPLKDALDKVIKELLEMHRLGHLRIKYKIEENLELQELIKAMVKKDNIVQWLAGDQLKRDQLIFLYEMHKITCSSALKDYYLSFNTNKRIMEVVIP